MSPTDFSALLGRYRSGMAIFSTFDFDPLYFENRLLGSTSLEKARRILVFMDGGRYDQLVRRDIHARYVNERYLLVPIRPPNGAFHPKLHLLLQEKKALIFCGSNNLTPGGSTTNLELLNVVEVLQQTEDAGSHGLLADTMAFYLRACDYADRLLAATARKWLEEICRDQPWINTSDKLRSYPQLVTSADGPLWDQLDTAMADRKPDRILIISPFYDQDLRLLKAVRKRWPCPIEICAQEQTSHLPAKRLSKLENISLYSLQAENSRRLHAKLFACKLGKRWLCLTGSANFTTAAFEGQNMEVCLLFEQPQSAIDELLSKEVERRLVDPADFEPAPVEEAPISAQPKMILRSAYLDVTETVRLDAESETVDWDTIKAAFRKFSDHKSSLVKSVAHTNGQQAHVALAEQEIKDFHGAVICRLQGHAKDGSNVQSNPVWLVQPDKLTRSFGEGGGKTGRERLVLETGRGTVELLEDKINQQGLEAAIAWLNRLNIRFHADTMGSLNLKGLGHTIYDPTLPDTPPNWREDQMSDFVKAIEDFVQRHHVNILGKHARSGNINGMTNFVDVMVECNKLLFLRYRTGELKWGRAMEFILRGVGIMCAGYDFLNKNKPFHGFLINILEKQGGELDAIREALTEVSGFEHLAIALAMAQIIRWDKELQGCPQDQLVGEITKMNDTIKQMGGWEPIPDELTKALTAYGAIPQQDRDLILATILKTAPPKVTRKDQIDIQRLTRR
jgi:HKD family nuclease